MCPYTPDPSQVSHEEIEAMAPHPQSVQREPYLRPTPPEVFPKYASLPWRTLEGEHHLNVCFNKPALATLWFPPAKHQYSQCRAIRTV